MKFLYKNVAKPIFFRFNPEFIHHTLVLIGSFLGRFSLSRSLLALFYDYKGKDISKTVDGIRYRTPIILSAGFDYNADLPEILPSIGFGGIEMGSITAKPSKGNPKPQLTRLVKNRAILVNKGLANEGVESIIKKLKKKKKVRNFVWGISIARTNSENAGKSIDDGIKDYFTTFKRFVDENVGDYYTINISCPNAFTGETFSDNPDYLDRLLAKLTTVKTNKPVYVKLPINKEWDLIESLIKVVLKHKLQGVVIGNLNKDKSLLKYPEEIPEGRPGNLSGDTTRQLSNNLIKKTRDTFKQNLTIIGVGGIMSAEDAIEKFHLGADLIQLITGMIMEGPHLISEISKTYEQRF